MTRWFWMTAFAVSVLSFSSLPALADDPVVWTNAVGVSVSGNNLTKTDSSGTWNAGAASLNVIRDGNGFMETTVSEANKDRMIGLSHGDTDQNYPDIDYAFYLASSGILYIYEAGVYTTNLSSYGPGDRLRITVYDGVVFYLKNGAVVYTSAGIPQYPLRVDTSIASPGGTLTNVRVGNLVWTNGVGVSNTGDSLTKTGSAGWNAGASSTNTIESGDGYIEFNATETNTNRAAGLGNGDSNQTLADIEFGIVLHTDASVEISESGSSRGTFGSYASGDLFRVELSQGTIRYYQNGVNFYTSTVVPSYPLRADSSFDTVGGPCLQAHRNDG